MLSALKSLFKQKKSIDNVSDSLYKFKYIDVTEVDKYPDALHDIYSKKYDGMIIRNVFSKEETETMRLQILKMNKDNMTPTIGGHAFPKVFPQVVRPADKQPVTEEYLQNYFRECEKLPEVLANLLKVDFTKRLESIFSKISGKRSIAVPNGYKDEGKYANTTIRRTYPNEGYLNVHCGNYFQQEFPDIYKHLISQVNVINQLSYFVTVSRADKGGELTLFDLLWEPGQTKVDAGTDNEVILPSKKILDTSTNSLLKRQKEKPQEGDLLLFSGGRIWHKVELIEGAKERITVGGFMSFMEDDKKMMYWS